MAPSLLSGPLHVSREWLCSLWFSSQAYPPASPGVLGPHWWSVPAETPVTPHTVPADRTSCILLSAAPSLSSGCEKSLECQSLSLVSQKASALFWYHNDWWRGPSWTEIWKVVLAAGEGFQQSGWCFHLNFFQFLSDPAELCQISCLVQQLCSLWNIVKG